MSKPTPGPWAVEKPYGEPGLFVTAANPRLTNPLICRVMGEDKENALLLSLSPELLAALKDCAERLENYEQEADPFDMPSPELDRAKQLISKIEGD